MSAFYRRSTFLLFVVTSVIIANFGSFCYAFSLTQHSSVSALRSPNRKLLSHSISPVSRGSFEVSALPNSQLLFLADAGALDPETLESLGDIQELNEALDGAIDAANPAIGILSKLVASPAFLALPIGAGIVVSFLIGYFIFSYASGKDD